MAFLPNELLLLIAEQAVADISDKKERQQTIIKFGFINSLFDDFRRTHLFENVAVGVTPCVLIEDADMLTQNRIAPKVRKLRLSLFDEHQPKRYHLKRLLRCAEKNAVLDPLLEFPSGDEDCSCEEVDSTNWRECISKGPWFTRVSVHLDRLMSNLVRMEKLTIDIFVYHFDVRAMTFVREVAGILSRVSFPYLSYLKFNTDVLLDFSAFWDPELPFHDSLQENLLSIKRFQLGDATYKHCTISEAKHPPSAIRGLESWLQNIPLRSLALKKFWSYADGEDFKMQTLCPLTSLTHLELSCTHVGDKLSVLLASTKQLRFLTIVECLLQLEVDKWAYVFRSIAALRDLKTVKLRKLSYIMGGEQRYCPLNCGATLCTACAEDEDEFDQFTKDIYSRGGNMEAVARTWFICLDAVAHS